MTRRRWIADEVDGDRAALVGSHAAHLARVLRARVGQEFDIATGEQVRHGRIVSVAEDRVDFELLEAVDAAESAAIVLLLAVFKFDRFEWAVEKGTELGIERLIPFVARRTDSHLSQAAAKRCERWRRIAFEASQQSRRLSPPEISDPMKFKDAIAIPGGTKIVLSENERQLSLASHLSGEVELPLVMAIGPEGGWTTDELDAMERAGWKSASLGSTVLRAETAAIAAVSVANAMLF